LILPKSFSILPILSIDAFHPSLLPVGKIRTSDNGGRFSNTWLQLHSNEEDDDHDKNTFTIKVTHQNKTMTIPISPDEPILQALEKQDLQDKLSLHSLPQDCRRGNCLTCSGRILSGNAKDILMDDDGLTPSMSDRISKKNLVLTCSSYVKSDGIHLELGVCDDAWRELWGGSQPWVDEEGEIIRNDAVARAIRMNDEKSLNRWILKTEKMLSKVDVEDDYHGEF
jgi:ferredoxin